MRELLRVSSFALHDYVMKAQTEILVTPEQEAAFLLSLQAGNYEGVFETYLQKHYPGTCNWIVESSEYSTWEIGRDERDVPESVPRTLWLVGHAGSGKSVMAAFLIAKLQDKYRPRSDILVLYHFCSKSKPVDILAALLHQVLRERTKSCSMVKNELAHGDPYFRGKGKLLKALREVLRRLDIKKVFVILDAIDECDEDPDGQFLNDLLEMSSNNEHLGIRFFFTSRPTLPPNRELRLRGSSVNIRQINLQLRSDFIQNDITMVVKQELDKFEQAYIDLPDTRERVEDAILAHAGKLFLMAHFALDTFRDRQIWTPAIVEEQIRKVQNLGTTLQDTYKSIIQDMEEEAWKRAAKLLKWLIAGGHDEKRLVSVADGNVILGLERSHLSWTDLNKDLQQKDEAENLKRVCGLLVDIDKAFKTVRIVHLSVAEYLLRKPKSKQDRCFTLEQAQIECALGCVTYLGFTDFSNDNLHEGQHTEDAHRRYRNANWHPPNQYENDHCFLSTRPLLQYAAIHWAGHIKTCERLIHPPSVTPRTNQGYSVRANNEDWNHIVHWIQKHQNMKLAFRLFWYFRGSAPPKFLEYAQPFDILCYFGLEVLVRYWLEDPNLASSFSIAQSLALHMAAIEGHAELVKLLLDTNQRDSVEWQKLLEAKIENRTPLQLAVENGHTQTAQVLLSIRQQYRLETELILAANSGRKDMVELILGHMDPDEPHQLDVGIDERGCPLEIALSKEYFDVANLLLDYGADPNGSKGEHNGPLQYVAFSGNFELVQRLVEGGATVDSAPGLFGSALQTASHQGHQEIMEYLKSKGANPPPTETEVGPQGPATQVLQTIRADMERNNFTDVERKAEDFRKKVEQAIAKRNLKELDILMGLGIQGFKIAVKLGRETPLLFMSNVAVSLLDSTVELAQARAQGSLHEAVGKITSWFAVGLEIAVVERPLLIRRTMEQCLMRFRDLIDTRNDHGAAIHVRSGIEILLSTTKRQHPELIALITDIFAGIFEELLTGRFASRTQSIIHEYAAKFVKSFVNSDWSSMHTLATAGIVFLQKAIDMGKTTVVRTLADIYWKEGVQKLQDHFAQVKFLPENFNDDGVALLSDRLLDVGAALLEFYESDDSTAARELVSTPIIWLMQIAQTAEKVSEVEDFINRVARKQIRDGRWKDRNQKDSNGHVVTTTSTPGDRHRCVEKVFVVARERASDDTIRQILERIIADLMHDRQPEREPERASPPQNQTGRRAESRRQRMLAKMAYLWCLK
jgi:ABC-type dipeptide/oligopeptide/nickel transport system ATPase component